MIFRTRRRNISLATLTDTNSRSTKRRDWRTARRSTSRTLFLFEEAEKLKLRAAAGSLGRRTADARDPRGADIDLAVRPNPGFFRARLDLKAASGAPERLERRVGAEALVSIAYDRERGSSFGCLRHADAFGSSLSFKTSCPG